jgi:hypothetical protein
MPPGISALLKALQMRQRPATRSSTAIFGGCTMGLIACLHRTAEWRHKEIELAAHQLAMPRPKDRLTKSGARPRAHAVPRCFGASLGANADHHASHLIRACSRSTANRGPDPTIPPRARTSTIHAPALPHSVAALSYGLSRGESDQAPFG